jgi:hypothetical protein
MIGLDVLRDTSPSKPAIIVDDAPSLESKSQGALFRLGLQRLNPDVEVQHLLTGPKLLVERDGWIVTVIGLNIDDPNATSGGNLS